MFVPFIRTPSFDCMATLSSLADLLPRGQWVSVDGRKGRLIGMVDGHAWVCWQDTGCGNAAFARACRAMDRAALAQNRAVAPISDRPATLPAAVMIVASLGLALAAFVASIIGQDWRLAIGAALAVASARFVHSTANGAPIDPASKGYSMRVAR